MKFLCRSLVILLLLVPLTLDAWGADDGFGVSTKIEGAHFTLYYRDSVNLENLIEELSISKTDQVLANQKIDTASASAQLASMVDVLFNRASDVLDMHIYSLKADIKIFATQDELSVFYNNLYHAQLPCTGFAFYVHNFKTIYITAENFRREVLGHEMGHAIMSHYFVVEPSIKIQEVLAGYVEYQLRKSK